MTPPELSRSRYLLFAFATIAIALLCIELLFQSFYYHTAGDFLFNRAFPAIFESDELRCFRTKPDLDYVHRTNEFSMHVYTDALGLRARAPGDGPVAYEKTPGVKRVLFLGPSFAFGWGSEYEETYASRIAEGLTRRGQAVELMNLGTPAQSPSAQLCWLRKEGFRYAPDVIVQTDYGSIGGVGDGCPEELECPVVEDGVLWRDPPTLGRRAFNTMKNLGVVFYGFYAVSALRGTREAGADGTGKELYGKDDPRAAGDDPFQAARAYARYQEYVRGVLGENVAVAFLYIPLSYVVHPEDAPRWWSLGEVDPHAERRELAAAAAAIREQGIPFVDGTEALVASAAGGERLYYWLDIHLTPRGNDVVAEAALPILGDLLHSIPNPEDR